jgi:hypothetical protein
METKDLHTKEDALEFAEKMHNDDNAVDIAKTADGLFRVRWIKNKKYTTYDGKEFTDEVWMTEKEELICIQDLTEAHAKNIIRMMLRNSRETNQAATAMLESLSALADVFATSNEVEIPESSNHVLH